MDQHGALIALADEYWDGLMAAYPTEATLLGDRRFDDRIEDLSAEADDQRRSAWAGLLERLDGIDRDGLSAEDGVTCGLLRGELTAGIDGLDQRLTEMASDQMGGVHAGLLTVAPEINAPTPANARALVGRYRQIGSMFDQAVERFRAGLAAGRTPARITIERSLHQLDGYLGSDVATDPFVTLDGPAGWEGEAAWRDELATITREVIRPAFERYRQVLADELAPAARADDRCGLGWLDGGAGSDRGQGAALYDTLVRQHTTLDDLGPDEIHELGLAELERLTGEYAGVGGRLFGTGDQSEVFGRLLGDPTLRYRTGDEIMADARRCLEAASAAWATGSGVCRAASATSSRFPSTWPPTRRPPTTSPPPSMVPVPAPTTSTPTSPKVATATRRRRSPSTKPSPATTSSWPSPPSSTTCPASSG